MGSTATLRRQGLIHTDDPQALAEQQARRACSLIRCGHIDAARALIVELRRAFGDGRSGRVTVWILLAEGLDLLHGGLVAQARDKISRAQLLASAMRYPAMCSLASAWQAQFDLNAARPGSMLAALGTAIAHAASRDHESRTRISMVISNAYMLCGEFAAAQKWFLRGHHHAVESGDQASIHALLNNRAAFKLAWLRAAHCTSPVADRTLGLLRAEFRSAANLQRLLQIQGLAEPAELCEARLCLLAGDHAAAQASLLAVRDSRAGSPGAVDSGLLELELAFALSMQGDIDEALSIYESIDPIGGPTRDPGDALWAAWLAWKMSTVDGRIGDVQSLKAGLDAALATFHQTRMKLKSGLDALVLD
jgi:hypothetical protein